MMNETVRVTKIFVFDMAHALFGYDGPCKNIHGHTYKLSVTLKGKPFNDNSNPKAGMVIDFSILKQIVQEKIIKQFDHALVLNNDSPHKLLDKVLTQQFEKIIYLDVQPTCENLLLHFKKQLASHFADKIKLVYLKLEETPTSYSEWCIDDN
ncbi:MAG TPA: 6-carboxytetrahydropterin synthase [Bacteroidia bacterium]|nr:6-carboxytetrahydropterin synthase [Bacteroidia bacterium]MBP7713183.1 6-carboxytetrahydropterin synthase [Bacteroidia bacterium]MBP8667268.1 6-carboxytetrahydropterin synthase [Bacteroidia bacterium]HOZ83212.1 6-carboxytetrahydropterin synthase [Bacteroidia bacterium]HOZ90457.1 6-carboxytetrahydropterin synthase [Bacteroidia bacterium]